MNLETTSDLGRKMFFVFMSDEFSGALRVMISEGGIVVNLINEFQPTGDGSLSFLPVARLFFSCYN